MAYEKKFEKPYKDGWKNSPFKETPITAEVLNGYDAAIDNVEKFLVEFSKQINRDYYGTDGTAPMFDLMPNKSTWTALSRLGACYISTTAEAETCNAPAPGIAFAFGGSTSRYAIILIGNDGAGMWYRTFASEWIKLPSASTS